MEDGRRLLDKQNITLAVLVNIASTPLGTASIDCELLQRQTNLPGELESVCRIWRASAGVPAAPRASEVL
ncbi:hypothetical protein A8E25_18135 [Burkholderia cenocepacia]|nr:hypothetical protein A8E17_19335 [Burkholderia cenocepacia]ONR68196.1 hypothetical protein A8E23_20615 [Burkholderia cenocepacia]ONR71722.1 hypothetical protein A8E18_16305 [Burkholderia cenocepacia]ONR78634.1 hypothetical protein A8E22_19845 [Burkholderia cenocepacia]ONR91830.1 hypothetical protein A8E25_18135 [Burkholderia cenocepacia]